jgi:hypothetical protein
MENTHPCASNALFGLTMIPVVVWIFWFLIFVEIRSVIEAGVEIRPHSRLHVVHSGLVMITITLSVTAMRTLILYCPQG